VCAIARFIFETTQRISVKFRIGVYNKNCLSNVFSISTVHYSTVHTVQVLE
jgi:ferredoxin-fold anticodon binding domain-containing protein